MPNPVRKKRGPPDRLIARRQGKGRPAIGLEVTVQTPSTATPGNGTPNSTAPAATATNKP